MNESIILQDLELWEAWVEFDHLHPSRFGYLYVLGEAPVNVKDRKVSIIKTVDENDPGRLILTIPKKQLTGRVRMKEVMYSEPVNKINHYRSIVIYLGTEFLLEINDIEVLI